MKTKASTSKRGRKTAGKRHHPKSRPVRRSTRRAGSVAAKTVVPVIAGSAPVDFPSVLPVDKRDDELTDEESLDREERQDLY